MAFSSCMESSRLFKLNNMKKNKNKRIQYCYRYLNGNQLIIIIPKCQLEKKMFNLKDENWGDFKIRCMVLLALLKAWQFQQTNGLDWFYPDDKILDKFQPKWRFCLMELVRLKIVEVNPINNKLNFRDNMSIYQKLPNKDCFKNKLKQLGNLLVQIDFEKYNEFFKERNQNKLRLMYNNF